MDMIRLALLLAQSMGHSTYEAYTIAQAIGRACGDDVQCIIDGDVYADHESNFQAHPRAFSHDAKAHVSCGALQTPCGIGDLDDQARYWARLRASSLKQCGNLAQLASGSCTRGTVLARARAAEAELWAATASEWAAP